ncbi:hypothetical protein S7711_05468 [Stachybotrys chartarum IBT 7711]|uniref:Uncharacterized protein n=1 Tax=Stachybotrys chartarum (strain CBS 109288 / IBT 7711) TaxID=1280523 RepID=A0A084BAZ0_STACB|nr:hypothetical protein S7711_05468 [Stachybotrys chartarum IBT 7711]KFA46235.1 hypothetical protein S40293_07169 [Stachybotrys chartarum IBT 40293]
MSCSPYPEAYASGVRVSSVCSGSAPRQPLTSTHIGEESHLRTSSPLLLASPIPAPSRRPSPCTPPPPYYIQPESSVASGGFVRPTHSTSLHSALNTGVNTVEMPSTSEEPSQHSQATQPLGLSAYSASVFDALESGTRSSCIIDNHEQLGICELTRCWETLHKCGVASEVNASLKKTRESIESFLDAIFRDWNSHDQRVQVKPELKPVQVRIDVGHFLGENTWIQLHFGQFIKVNTVDTDTMASHAERDCCPDANTVIRAVGIYVFASSAYTRRLVMVDDSEEHDFDDCTGNNMHFSDDDWTGALERALYEKAVSKVRRHNQRLAIFKARMAIRDSAMGFTRTRDKFTIETLDYVDVAAVKRRLRVVGLLPESEEEEV